MFKKKTVAPQVDVPGTVIGKGITLESALLTGKESVRIDGVFLGDVDLDGSLILGETGSIEGAVRAKYIILAGIVRGNIESETLHVSPTARINGDITTQSIIVDEGGQLNGRYQVGKRPGSSTDVQSLLPNADATPRLTGEKSYEKSYDKSFDKSYLDKSLEIVENQESKIKKALKSE